MESARDLGRILLAGFSPLILWEVFSVVYYGFPFPNTAYAKLASGIPATDLWLQGVLYYLSQLAFDPFSLMATAWALLFVLLRRERALYALAVGLGLDLIYIVSIGGDFMAGRHFSLVVVMAAMLLAHALSDFIKTSNHSSYIPAAATIAAGMVMSPHPPVAMSPDYALVKNPISNEAWDERGVCDERAFYSVSVALLRANRDTNMPNNWHKGRGLGVPPTAVEAMAQVGVAGFFAPPTAIIIDSYGLGDAFIARLPAAKKVGWRPGHYAREIPSGYADTLREGRNLLAKREDAWLYDRIKLVASGPIWSWERWKEIVRLNLGLSPPDVVVPDRPRRKRIR
jgi:arabinofuranosyltransferase